MRFESPWMFLLLPLVAAALWRRVQAGSPAVRFSSIATARAVGASARARLAALPTWLRAAALVLFVIALARPQAGTEKVSDFSRGVAMEIVIDRSSSMGAEMRHQGSRLNRLEVVKSVILDFVDGGGELPGRPNDLLGLITFARYSDTVCPLTLSHGALEELIRNVELVRRRSEDGTAIGDAVALAAARLNTAEAALQKRSESDRRFEIKSKVIILLTDGENNAGDRGMEQAAEIAAEWGVKVYAIGVGDDRGIRTPFGVINVPKRLDFDDGGLRRLAERTGGIYRMAGDARTLTDIYREIDQLERSEIESVRYLDYRELFLPFALLGFALAAAETVLRATWLRTIP